jgi:hypothetical protein
MNPNFRNCRFLQILGNGKKEKEMRTEKFHADACVACGYSDASERPTPVYDKHFNGLIEKTVRICDKCWRELAKVKQIKRDPNPPLKVEAAAV